MEFRQNRSIRADGHLVSLFRFAECKRDSSDGYVITIVQLGCVGEFVAVQPGTVVAVQVLHSEAVADPEYLGMLAANHGVVREGFQYVAIRLAAQSASWLLYAIRSSVGRAGDNLRILDLRRNLR